MSSDDAIAGPRTAGNRFNRMEWAGAFGDLGTLIPFVLAYVSVLKLDPLGVLLGFGIPLIICGLWYKTPFPVQPMKALGAVATTQAAQTAVITPHAVYGAGLVTGLIWLVLGMTGAAKYVTALVNRPVVIGIVLGLGLGFMLEGARLMAANWLLSGALLLIGLLLLSSRKIPAMLVLLAAGACIALWRDPAIVHAVGGIRPEPRLPSFALTGITWSDFVIAVVFLALPQVPLTLGNALIAVVDENNRLFPDKRVTERSVATSTGLMNMFSAGIGGVPMCHGAGGMAGHVRFGARTGGAPIILGVLLVLLAIFFSGSVQTIFGIIPAEVLGLILFLTGAQLALGSCDFSKDKGERFVTLVTAGLAMWNVGLAFVAGMAIYHLYKRKWLHL